MKRVTIVNLAGRAFHLEEGAERAIAAWLDDARVRLAADPDRDELLADFERAIADKCAAAAPGERDVVTDEHARAILETLGTVEPVEPGPGGEAGEQATTELPRSDAGSEEPRPWRERHLYRLTGQGEGQIAGVCAGIAAYLNVDVTVIRVLVVILAIATGGGAAVGYIAAALLIPEANSPAERAAVRGYGETAQEMMSRARANAGPALASLGTALLRIWHVLLDVLHGIAIALTWLLLASWAAVVVWVLADGDGIMEAFDRGTSNWLVALWLTCIAWVLVSFCLRIAIASGRDDAADPGVPPRRRSRTLAIARDSVWFVSVVAALLAVFAIPASHSKQLTGLDDGQGRVHLFDEVICVRDAQHAGAASEQCHRGDDVVRWNE